MPNVLDVKLYVDGRLQGISAQLDEPINTATAFAGGVRIGRDHQGSRQYDGLLDAAATAAGCLQSAHSGQKPVRLLPLG